jgi:translation initiation factor 2B subunit (eIF-2B alpha/beta/delta family)
MPSKDPLQDVQDLAQRLADDAQTVAKEATSAIQRIADEGIDFTHDTLQVALDSISLARTQLEKAGRALGQIGKAQDSNPPTDP